MYKPNNCGYKWIIPDIFQYRHFLSFQKYNCRVHYKEFGPVDICDDNFITLALILNGFRYKHKVTRDMTDIYVYGRKTKFLHDMYDLGFKCCCASVK